MKLYLTSAGCFLLSNFSISFHERSSYKEWVKMRSVDLSVLVLSGTKESMGYFTLGNGGTLRKMVKTIVSHMWTVFQKAPTLKRKEHIFL